MKKKHEHCQSGFLYVINPKYMKLIPKPEIKFLCDKKHLHGVLTNIKDPTEEKAE